MLNDNYHVDFPTIDLVVYSDNLSATNDKVSIMSVRNSLALQVTSIYQAQSQYIVQ